MASCCRAGPCEEMFKPRFARRTLKRYREKGVDAIERQMVDAASAQGLMGARVLEIGGGIGTLQTELLRAGAERGEVVELLDAYEPYARELAREHGFEERSTFTVADVLDDPESIEPADVVLLNRVVCCSPDGIELTARAASLARQSLVLSFPRDVLWVRVGLSLVNAGQWVFRRSFRVFLHSPAVLAGAARAEGLAPVESGHGLIWAFAAFRR